jgi:hypothetical protein
LKVGMMKSSLSLLCIGFVSAASLFSVSNSWAEESPTFLAERGKLLLSEDFSGGDGWTRPKGKWEAAGGVLRGDEKPEDKHGAVSRHKIELKDAVIQVGVRLDGCKTATLSINDSKGHLCRLLIRPTGFTVQKDDHDHAGPDKAVVFQTVETPVEAGVWHTFSLEMVGNELLGAMDGKHIGFGAHDAIRTPKADLGLTVSGQGASFKALRIWEATKNPGWEATKSKLPAPASPAAVGRKKGV